MNIRDVEEMNKARRKYLKEMDELNEKKKREGKQEFEGADKARYDYIRSRLKELGEIDMP